MNPILVSGAFLLILIWAVVCQCRRSAELKRLDAEFDKALGDARRYQERGQVLNAKAALKRAKCIHNEARKVIGDPPRDF